jgi:hypothetical protein
VTDFSYKQSRSFISFFSGLGENIDFKNSIIVLLSVKKYKLKSIFGFDYSQLLQ